MIALAILFYLMFAHYIADFRWQTDWQAQNKWNNNVALGRHVAVYTAAMTMFLLPFGWHYSFLALLKFTLITGVAHFATDWSTSKWSHFYFEKKDFHNGFSAVGFDQWLHLVQLTLTVWYVGFAGVA